MADRRPTPLARGSTAGSRIAAALVILACALSIAGCGAGYYAPAGYGEAPYGGRNPPNTPSGSPYGEWNNPTPPLCGQC